MAGIDFGSTSGWQRGLIGAMTGGLSEVARQGQMQKQDQVRALGSVFATAETPADAIQQLAAIGTPDAVAMAQEIYKSVNKPSEGFTLGEGQKRFDASGREIAGVEKAPETISPYQQAQLDISRENLALQQQKALQEKQPTEGQANAALYASRMVDANNQLERVLESGYSPSRGRDWVPNELMSEAGQLFDQAQRNFINATLRRESGAVISDDEFANARQQYFPQPGDSEKTLEQKAQNRARAIEGISNAAGPAKSNIPAMAPKAGVIEDGYKFKGGNPADPNNWEKQ